MSGSNTLPIRLGYSPAQARSAQLRIREVDREGCAPRAIACDVYAWAADWPMPDGVEPLPIEAGKGFGRFHPPKRPHEGEAGKAYPWKLLAARNRCDALADAVRRGTPAGLPASVPIHPSLWLCDERWRVPVEQRELRIAGPGRVLVPETVLEGEPPQPDTVAILATRRGYAEARTVSQRQRRFPLQLQVDALHLVAAEEAPDGYVWLRIVTPAAEQTRPKRRPGRPRKSASHSVVVSA